MLYGTSGKQAQQGKHSLNELSRDFTVKSYILHCHLFFHVGLTGEQTDYVDKFIFI